MSRVLKIFVLCFISVVFYNLIFTSTVSAASYYKKILTVGINPVENGENVVGKFWGNASTIENVIFNTAISGFSNASNGNITYAIVDHINVDEFPDLPSGQPVFNMESYSKCVGGGTQEDIQNCDNSKWQFDYSKFFNDYGICIRANDVNADEIWMVTPPYIGKFESFMIGPYLGFWINGEAVTNASCNKLYPVMGPTYDRQDTLLHNFGHRFESTFEYLFTNILASERNNHWRRFSGFGGQTLGCGNTHFPANYRYDYDYGNNAAGTFTCPDWENFPNYTGATINVGCNSWGCNDPGWESFWFSFIPSSSGDAVLHNANNTPLYMKKDWWYYLLNPDLAINFVNYTYNPGPVIVECNFNYSNWSMCTGGNQNRTVTSTYPDGCSGGNPQLSQSCTVCYKYKYSNWRDCIGNSQRRTISERTEANCPGEQLAVLEQSCTPEASNNNNSNNSNDQTDSPDESSAEQGPTKQVNNDRPEIVPTSFTLEGILRALFGINTSNTDPNNVSYPVYPPEILNQQLVNLIALLSLVSGGLLVVIVFFYSGGLSRFKILK